MVDEAQCIIDVLKMKMYKFGPEGGKPEKLEIPADQKEIADELHNELVEKAAENDEDLMELYFDKGTLNEDEMREGIKKFSNWPTIPQLYVKEEFIGGCDIVKEMHETGELTELLSSRGIDVKPS